MFTAAMLEERNNRMIFLREMNFILMQIWFIVWLLQHGRREHTLFEYPDLVWGYKHNVTLRWPNTVFQYTDGSKHYLKTKYFWVPGMVQD